MKDFSVSSICFGCEPLGGVDWGNIDINSIKKAIYKGLDLGVNFFDTAGVYGLGLSEERLSKILGVSRHDVVIATKGGLSWKLKSSGRAIVRRDSSPSSIRKDVETSLQRLRLERLPIFYVHWPDNITPITDTFFELEKIRKEGKIKSIGCSNFSVHQIEEACSVSKVEYIQQPINLLDGLLDKNIEKICTQQRIKVIAYNVLAFGLLSGKYQKNSYFSENDRRSRLDLFKGDNFENALRVVEKLKIEASENDRTILQHSISWVLSQKNVASAIVGIKNPNQMEENWSAIT